MGGGGAFPASILLVSALHILLAAPGAVAQLPSPSVKYAPCRDATELTCSGAAGTAAICCNKGLFRCATRIDNGAPRCALCPQTCIMDCSPGYVCGKDANGCFTCIADSSGSGGSGFIRAPPPSPPSPSPPSPSPSSPPPSPPAENRLGDMCSAAQPCPAGQICAAGYCRADPCKAVACPAARPKCKVDASYRSQCTAVPRPPPSPAPGKKCLRPCGAGFKCQKKATGSWQCTRLPGVRRSSRAASAAGHRGGRRRLASFHRRELR